MTIEDLIPGMNYTAFLVGSDTLGKKLMFDTQI